MPDRKDLDRPAIVILAVSGLVFMAVSIPFLPGLYCKSPAAKCEQAPAGATFEYRVGWSPVLTGPPVDVTLTQAPGSQAGSKAISAVLTSSVHVILGPGACSDTFNPNTQQSAATMTWTLTRNGAAMGAPRSFTCAQAQAGFDEEVVANGAPELGSVQASNETAARASVANSTAAQAESAVYELTVRAERTASPVPSLPPANPAPTLNVKLTLRIEQYQVGLSKVEAPEVGR